MPEQGFIAIPVEVLPWPIHLGFRVLLKSDAVGSVLLR